MKSLLVDVFIFRFCSDAKSHLRAAVWRTWVALAFARSRVASPSISMAARSARCSSGRALKWRYKMRKRCYWQSRQRAGRSHESYSVDEIFKGDLAIDLTIDYWGVLWGLSDYLMYVDTKVIKWMLLGDFEGVFTFTCLRRAANAG